jgi:SPP1 gp7 family putative phage head morphogenesis protein
MDKDKQKALEEMEKRLELNLIQNYSSALKEVKSLLSFYHEKYATGEELTLQEMNKFNRLKTLELQFSNVLNTMSANNEKNVNDSLAEQYTEAFYRTGYGLEQEVKADLNFGLINPNLVYEAVQAPIDKLTLSDRMEGRRKEITKKVRDGITQGLLQGEGYAKMSQRLTGIFEGEARNLTRIARTEGHRVQESASFESQKHVQDQGVQMVKVWVAALDGRTRDAHRKLDGQKVPLDEHFEINGNKALYPSDFGIAAQDIHCRCTTVTEIEGFSPLFERRARGKDGKGEVISYKTYEQWEKGVKTKKLTIEGLSPKQEKDLKKRFAIPEKTEGINVQKELIQDFSDMPKVLPRKRRDEFDTWEEGEAYREKYNKSLDEYDEWAEKKAKEFVKKETFFKTREEAEKFIKKNILHPDGEINIEGVELPIVSAYCRMFEQVAKDFPQLKNSYLFFDNHQEKGDRYVMEASNGIHFGVHDVKTLYDNVTANAQSGYLTGNSVYNIFLHEIGHYVDRTISNPVKSDDFSERKIGSYWRDVYFRNSGIDQHLRVARSLKDPDEYEKHTKNFLSEYSGYNDAEMFAELFSAAYTESDNENVIKFREWLSKVSKAEKEGKNRILKSDAKSVMEAHERASNETGLELWFD